jgi:hypothetical protein
MRTRIVEAALAMASAAAVWVALAFVAAAPAHAILPTGYIYLLNQGVRSPSGEYLGMDVLSPAGQLTGSVYLNPAKKGRYSQQWTGIRTVDPLYQKLQNRQTGQCISHYAQMAPCSSASTLWRVYTYNRPVTYAFVRLGYDSVLTAAGVPGAMHLETGDARDNIQPREQWQTATA